MAFAIDRKEAGAKKKSGCIHNMFHDHINHTDNLVHTHIDAIMNMPHVVFLVSVCRQTVRDWGLLQQDMVLIEHMKKWATLTCPSP